MGQKRLGEWYSRQKVGELRGCREKKLKVHIYWSFYADQIF